MPKQKKKRADWELEQPFDQAATLEELVEASPFHDASDERGESVTAGTRIPRWLFRRVVKLVETQGSPYEINSDALRDAVYIGLRVLHMRYKLSPDWSVETKLASVAEATGIMKRIKSQVGELVSGLETLRSEGELDMAAEKLTEYISAAVELEDEWHRERLFKLLREDAVVREIAKKCSTGARDLILGGKQ